MKKPYIKTFWTSNGMKKIFFFFIFLLLLPLAKIHAESISLGLPKTVQVGEIFEVLVQADSGGNLVNSVSIMLDYDENLLSFSGFKESETVINLWVDSPREERGRVYFSGIVPGGVLGLYDPRKTELEDIPLTRLLFTARGAGRAEFSFANSEILKHDGRGSALSHQRIGGGLEIVFSSIESDQSGQAGNLDTEKPKPFKIIFLESGFFSRTPPMIIFNTNDVGSGIKEYKVKMSGLGWRTVESPMPISRGIFPLNIVIRAFDFSGNFQDAGISIPGMFSYRWLGIIFMLFVLCVMGLKVLKYRA